MPIQGESSNLDLLRSVAVLAVLLNHLMLFLGWSHDGDFIRPLGRWGVLLFFIHTSLVLLLSLERQAERRYVHNYAVFLLRRALRIYPLALFAIALVCILRLPLGHFEAGAFLPAQLDARTLLANVLLIQNLSNVESVLDPLWSLPFELQMYLVLPGLFALCAPALPLLRGPGKVALALGLWLGGAGLAFIVERSFHAGLLAFVPCFLGGVVAHVLWRCPRRLPALAWPVCLALATAVYLAHPGEHSGWLCCLFVGACLPWLRELPYPTLNRASQLIARYSYGVYLTHGMCIWLSFDALAALPSAARWAIFVATTLLAPVALYHAIEAPLIGAGQWLTARMARRPASIPPLPNAEVAT